MDMGMGMGMDGWMDGVVNHALRRLGCGGGDGLGVEVKVIGCSVRVESVLR